MIEITVVRMPNGFTRYDLVKSFLELRKAVFVDKMKWPLYQYEAIEFEQYDTFSAVYIIAHENGKVLGGARMIRSDQQIGTGSVRYSYMIRDAQMGLLPGMPTNICNAAAPTNRKIWELTRLATLPNVDVAPMILHAANRFLISEDATTCLFLGPPAFLRMAKSMGYTPKAMGPIVKNDDGSFLAFSCDVEIFEDTPAQGASYNDLGAGHSYELSEIRPR